MFVFSARNEASLRSVRWAMKLHQGLQSPASKFILEKMLGGHRTVRESLMDGLVELGHHPHLNSLPPYPSEHILGVLAGKKIARSFVSDSVSFVLGPNYSVSPRFDPEVFLSAHAKAIVVPSKWVLDFYAREMPEILGKLKVWSAGVDHKYWSPTADAQNRSTFIVYLKAYSPHEVSEVVGLLDEIGADWHVIEYGLYSRAEYLSVLRKARAMIVLGSSESQGIAHFEAWSADVPTFVKFSDRPISGGKLKGGDNVIISAGEWSPSPYLSWDTGATWQNREELKGLCLEVLGRRVSWSPRRSILSSHTLGHAAEKYLSILRPNEERNAR